MRLNVTNLGTFRHEKERSKFLLTNISVICSVSLYLNLQDKSRE